MHLIWPTPDMMGHTTEHAMSDMSEPLPCPCGEDCSLGIQMMGGGKPRVVAWPCGAEGPSFGNVITDDDAIRMWNEWILGIEKMKSLTTYSP